MEKGDIIYPRTDSFLPVRIGFEHRSANPPIFSPQ